MLNNKKYISSRNPCTFEHLYDFASKGDFFFGNECQKSPYTNILLPRASERTNEQRAVINIDVNYKSNKIIAVQIAAISFQWLSKRKKKLGIKFTFYLIFSLINSDLNFHFSSLPCSQAVASVKWQEKWILE